MIQLTSDQARIAANPLQSKTFLHGPAGTGKTTAAVARLLSLLEAGVPGESILLLVPQRTLGMPYVDALYESDHHQGGMVSVLTVNGIAQRMIELFWPILASKAGFGSPGEPPVFLTLESAQYYMAQVVKPLLDQGYFDSVVMDRNRLYSQIIDNLNKAAVVGFSLSEIGDRLTGAWAGERSQVSVYENAQHCATLFRQFCLANNLLDFSLQLDTFMAHGWTNTTCRNYLSSTYRHLIVDNVEEDTPVSHDFIREWLPDFDSALVLYDEGAGYRRFLGADPESGAVLINHLPERVRFNHSFVMDKQIHTVEKLLRNQLSPGDLPPNEALLVGDHEPDPSPSPVESWNGVLSFKAHQFFPDMLNWTVDQIARLVEEGIPPGEIAVMSPFLSDALRFAITQRLEERGIPSRSHRPSRSLREEPVTQCLFTLSLLAHPHWLASLAEEAPPSTFDVAYALVQTIEGVDLIRAQLLAQIVYRIREAVPTLSSFDLIKPDMQERITYSAGERYERLRQWLEEYRQGPPQELDHFLSRLFGEVLSQPGFAFHRNYSSGELTANLLESIQKFRWVAAAVLATEGRTLGQEYVDMVQGGVIAAQYLRSWQTLSKDAVMIAPAYTFLMANSPVDYQIWLDIGSRAWFERLYQPLTHPYVLSRRWSLGDKWTDVHEVQTGQDALYRLVSGLVRRCRHGIILGLSDLGEQGFETRGPLLRTFQHVLRSVKS